MGLFTVPAPDWYFRMRRFTFAMRVRDSGSVDVISRLTTDGYGIMLTLSVIRSTYHSLPTCLTSIFMKSVVVWLNGSGCVAVRNTKPGVVGIPGFFQSSPLAIARFSGVLASHVSLLLMMLVPYH